MPSPFRVLKETVVSSLEASAHPRLRAGSGGRQGRALGRCPSPWLPPGQGGGRDGGNGMFKKVLVTFGSKHMYKVSLTMCFLRISFFLFLKPF